VTNPRWLLLGSGVMTRDWVACLKGVCDGGRGTGKPTGPHEEPLTS
jgi:hypothetical protein